MYDMAFRRLMCCYETAYLLLLAIATVS